MGQGAGGEKSTLCTLVMLMKNMDGSLSKTSQQNIYIYLQKVIFGPVSTMSRA